MPIKTTNIAYLAGGINYGGAPKSLLLLLKSLEKYEYKKYIYTIVNKTMDLKNEFLNFSDSFKIVDIKPIIYNQIPDTNSSIISFKINSLLSNKKFVDDLLKEKIDILHVNSTIFPQITKWVKKYSKIKVITHVRELIPSNGNSTISNYMINQIKNNSDAIIAISDNEARNFYDHSNLHIIPNPFDFSELGSVYSTFREDNNIDGKTVIIGMMGGAFIRYKGHLDFIFALKKIIDTKTIKHKFLFVIIGVKPKRPFWKRLFRRLLFMGNYRVTINNYIADNNLGEHIKLIPPTNDILNILKEIDIFVRPSLSGDPWGRDIIEAMAMGKPVVATGDSEFFVENGKTGFLVPPQNPEKLSDKISELINDPEKRDIFGKRGHEKIKKMCDLNEYGSKIHKIYHDLMDQ